MALSLLELKHNSVDGYLYVEARCPYSLHALHSCCVEVFLRCDQSLRFLAGHPACLLNSGGTKAGLCFKRPLNGMAGTLAA